MDGRAATDKPDDGSWVERASFLEYRVPTVVAPVIAVGGARHWTWGFGGKKPGGFFGGNFGGFFCFWKKKSKAPLSRDIATDERAAPGASEIERWDFAEYVKVPASAYMLWIRTTRMSKLGTFATSYVTAENNACQGPCGRQESSLAALREAGWGRIDPVGTSPWCYGAGADFRKQG